MILLGLRYSLWAQSLKLSIWQTSEDVIFKLQTTTSSHASRRIESGRIGRWMGAKVARRSHPRSRLFSDAAAGTSFEYRSNQRLRPSNRATK